MPRRAAGKHQSNKGPKFIVTEALARVGLAMLSRATATAGQRAQEAAHGVPVGLENRPPADKVLGGRAGQVVGEADGPHGPPLRHLTKVERGPLPQHRRGPLNLPEVPRRGHLGPAAIPDVLGQHEDDVHGRGGLERRLHEDQSQRQVLVVALAGL